MSFEKKIDLTMVIGIILVPIILFFSNTEWFYTPPGWLDPFMYLSYFKYYFQHDPIAHLDLYYKSSRLPWIIPGSIFYNLFSSGIAHILLNFFILYYIYFIFYFLTRLITSINNAVIITILFLFYSELHGNGGWEYHMIISLAYNITSMCFLILFLRNKKKKSLAVFSGVFFALALHNHPPFLVTLALNLFLIFKYKKFQIKFYFYYGILFAIGTVSITIFLMLYNKINGYDPLFFIHQIRYIISLGKTTSGNQSWLIDSKHLLFALSVYIFLILKNLYSLAQKKIKFYPYEIFYLFIFSFYLFMQIKGQTVLETDYQAILLSPFAFIGLAKTSKNLKQILDYKHIIFIIFILLFGFSIINLYIYNWFISFNFSKIIIFSLSILVFIIAIYFIRNISLKFISINLFFTSFLFSSFMNKNIINYSISTKYKYGKELFENLNKLDDFLQEHNPKTYTRTWYDAIEITKLKNDYEFNTGNLYASLSSLDGWCGIVLNCGSPNRYPKISTEELNQYPDKFELAIMSTNINKVLEGILALEKEHNRIIEPIKNQIIKSENFTIYINLVMVSKK